MTWIASAAVSKGFWRRFSIDDGSNTQGLNSAREQRLYQLQVRVYNRQRKRPVDLAKLRSFLGRLAHKLAPESGFSVVLISDPAMARYNARYRAHQGPTDVLSFPDAKAPWEEQNGYLGDILISVETADRRRPAGLRQEIESLCLHGLLHLLGYDHEKDEGQMEALEGRMRKELGLV